MGYDVVEVEVVEVVLCDVGYEVVSVVGDVIDLVLL